MPQAKLPLDLSKLPTPCRSMAQQARCFVGDDAKGAVGSFSNGKPWVSANCLFTGGVHMAVGQNLVPLVNIKIAGKWMFIPLKMVLIGIDP